MTIESGNLTLASGTTTADGAMQFDRTNEDLSIGDGAASRVVHMGTWKSWTPTFTGFSTDPVVTVARYTVVGKMVTMRLQTTSGTSDATTFTITIPVTASSTGKQFLSIAQVVNNGAFQTGQGLLRLNASSSTADVYRNGDQGATTWFAGGGKRVAFVVTYESN